MPIARTAEIILGQSQDWGIRFLDTAQQDMSSQQMDSPPLWQTSDPSVVSVLPSANASRCTVTAVNPGNANVRLTVMVSGRQLRATLPVVVKAPVVVSVLGSVDISTDPPPPLPPSPNSPDASPNSPDASPNSPDVVVVP